MWSKLNWQCNSCGLSAATRCLPRSRIQTESRMSQAVLKLVSVIHVPDVAPRLIYCCSQLCMRILMWAVLSGKVAISVDWRIGGNELPVLEKMKLAWSFWFWNEKMVECWRSNTDGQMHLIISIRSWLLTTSLIAKDRIESRTLIIK